MQLWIQASTSDVDLQATISEVRPDGKETFVQNGWLRASERKLDPRQSTLLAPVPTFRASDVRALPKGRKTLVTVPLYYEGHAYRAGSRIRVTISAPNGTQPIWSFARDSPEGPRNGVGRVLAQDALASGAPGDPGVAVPTPLPPCPGLRGEPCRTYVP